MIDYRLLPVKPTPEMVKAARDSYMRFGYMELAIRAALLAAPAVQGEPVGYVSQDFLDGKWTLDHIAKSDEGQISRTIPVFAKPPQPAEQQPDVTQQVEALEALLEVRVVEADASYGLACAKAEHALAAHRKGGDV